MISFQIEDIFKITGRGLVLAGKIQGGEPEIGNLIELEVNEVQKVRKIIGIEFLRNKNDVRALLIATENEAEIDEIRAWDHQRFVAKILV